MHQGLHNKCLSNKQFLSSHTGIHFLYFYHKSQSKYFGRYSIHIFLSHNISFHCNKVHHHKRNLINLLPYIFPYILLLIFLYIHKCHSKIYFILHKSNHFKNYHTLYYQCIFHLFDLNKSKILICILFVLMYHNNTMYHLRIGIK